MSRWQEYFDGHAFQANWKNLKEQLATLKGSKNPSSTTTVELARLKKIVSYIDDQMKAVDLELVPSSVWDNFNAKIPNIVGQLNNYINNLNVGHLSNANNECDQLLIYLHPHVMSIKESAQSAGRAFKAYSKAISDGQKSFREEAIEAIDVIGEHKEDSISTAKEIDDIAKRIKELETELLIGDDENDSLESSLETLKIEAEEAHSAIDAFHDKLTIGNEEESSIVLQIEQAKTESIEKQQKIDEAFESTGKTIRQLSNFHEKVFGVVDEEDKRVGGIEKELSKRNEELDNFKDQQETRYEELNKQIESLFPGAVSAGMASAYLELKGSFDKPIQTSTRLFYFSLFLLTITGLLLITDKIGLFYIDLIEVGDTQKLFNNLMLKLPIAIPLIWLTLFSSKRRSESRRLQQEYAHKEAIAKTYQSFKIQIENLGSDKDDALLKKLIESSIETISYNASTTLDGKHQDKMPIAEIVEKVVDKIRPQSSAS